MKKGQTAIFALLILLAFSAKSQTYPAFGQEIDVSITGLTFDAMEPFISPDGNFLLFNNLNDGINTKLYYATRVNDSTFTFVGEIGGANQSTQPHLDGVPDLDSLNNFYWTSTRDYPAQLDNLYHGTFSSGSVTNIGRVHGNFNKNIPGWLVMDHGISLDGQLLYFNNARFDDVNCTGPCETELGIAQKVNDSTFSILANSSAILQNIIDPNYIYYAPCISSDNLELYYSRYQKGTITPNTKFEICVAVRSSPADSFSVPSVLFSDFIAILIEAPVLTLDKQIIYYHRKTINSHKIVMRHRDSPLGRESAPEISQRISIFPNPAQQNITLEIDAYTPGLQFKIVGLLGNVVRKKQLIESKRHQVDLENLVPGVYFISLFQGDELLNSIKFLKK